MIFVMQQKEMETKIAEVVKIVHCFQISEKIMEIGEVVGEQVDSAFSHKNLFYRYVVQKNIRGEAGDAERVDGWVQKARGHGALIAWVRRSGPLQKYQKKSNLNCVELKF